MADFFAKMNEDYAQKHFPDGSVFESAAKTLKRRSMAVAIVIGIFAIASLWGLAWSAGRALELRASGQDDMLDVSIFICSFFGVMALVSLALLFFMIKASRQKRGDYIASAAKHSKLPESEIENFERQALSSDCYILRLTEGLDRALSNASNKDGLLTRDYIYLADPAQTVLRVDSLKACCFSSYTYSINTGNYHQKISCLAIYLLSSNGASILSDTTEKAGQALMALLQERNGAIDINQGKVLPEDGVDSYRRDRKSVV